MDLDVIGGNPCLYIELFLHLKEKATKHALGTLHAGTPEVEMRKYKYPV